MVRSPSHWQLQHHDCTPAPSPIPEESPLDRLPARTHDNPGTRFPADTVRHLMILPKVRDSRFITVRRGGSLKDDDHHLLATWAADCAQHVLHHFEQARPGDDRPRRAIELGRAWARGEIPWAQARTAAGHANAAAR